MHKTSFRDRILGIIASRDACRNISEMASIVAVGLMLAWLTDSQGQYNALAMIGVIAACGLIAGVAWALKYVHWISAALLFVLGEGQRETNLVH